MEANNVFFFKIIGHLLFWFVITYILQIGIKAEWQLSLILSLVLAYFSGFHIKLKTIM